MKHNKYRTSENFLRNGFLGAGDYGIPLIRRQKPDLSGLRFLGFHNARSGDRASRHCTIHFFLEDDKFNVVYTHPNRCLPRLKQYKQTLTPDFSVYTDMDKWRQLESIAHSRWCGAFWQEHGLLVIPTMTWADENSYDFCFTGVQPGSTVAVSTYGAGKRREGWLKGFEEMCRQLEPEMVLCYGKPFAGAERFARIRHVPHEGNFKRKTLSRSFPGQEEFVWADAM